MESISKFTLNHVTFPAKREIEKLLEGLVAHYGPSAIHWCDGSEEEFHFLCDKLGRKGLIRLDPEKQQNSMTSFPDPGDVAGLEERIFVCTTQKEDAGAANNWMDPKEMKSILDPLMNGCMRGRTLYVVPFCMGPLGSRYARYGIQFTDWEYMVVRMRMVTRIGEDVYPYIKEADYVECIHTVGAPLKPGGDDSKWPFNPKVRYIAYFPEESVIMSYGSGYGDNALLVKDLLSYR